ncbi:outer membrane protein [Candidatus Blochmanniella floridana]|uniref:Outer membrane protein n=1 Tax=Blochmanniella floridana TaxID=203907 RepID=Q7VRX0_BLOFL|nr:outer membrane protein [Candidatus Blochmannia floridanus]
MKLRYFTSLVVTMVIIAISTAGAAEFYKENNNNTLRIYGNITEGQIFVENKTNSDNHMSMKYGLIGKTYITDKIVGFGVWEQEFNLKNTESGVNLKNIAYPILGYIGIKLGDFGSIDYGRNYGVLYDVDSWVDLMPEFGGDMSIPDNFLTNRASNVVTYRNINFFGLLDGFNFAVQYQGKNDGSSDTGRTVKTENGSGYGVSASYALGNSGLSASAAYINCVRTVDQKSLDGAYTSDLAEAYSMGVKYDAYGAYLAAVYGESYNLMPFGNFDDVLNSEIIFGFVNKARNVAIVAQYKFDCGFSSLVSYLHSKASDVENGYGNYLKKCVTISSSYLLSKQLSATVDYRINLLHKTDFTTVAQINTDNMIALGVSYLF